jgi:hypothetical protein
VLGLKHAERQVEHTVCTCTQRWRYGCYLLLVINENHRHVHLDLYFLILGITSTGLRLGLISQESFRVRNSWPSPDH